MEKIKNQKCVKNLSNRMLAAKRQKNLAAVIAIILTSLLFTAVFTVGSGMMESFQEATMRQVGGSAMSGIKYILPEDYEKLSKDPAVKNPSYRILISGAENPELLKLSTEINYATKENAKAMFCLPEKGTMPEKRLELATSTLVLERLGIPCKIGETVTLEFNVYGKSITQDFTLSGYWEGDEVAMAQQVFLSREYCDEIVQVPKVSMEENSSGNYEGYWMMDFDFSNSWNIEKKTKDLLKRNGYNSKKVSYGVNWAYTTGSLDMETLVFFGGLILLILVSGYLIIYNIFSLNITMDIQNYGLYKTIGMTEKQLKKLVHHQAFLLSVLGIPCGLLSGTVFGKMLFPIIVRNFNTGGVVKNSLHPFIFLGAAAVSFLTVWISCGRPCRMAAKVSPIEAVRYNGTDSFKKKKKHTGRVTMRAFGWANLGRNKKKVALVVSSFSLSLILLNSVYVGIHGFHMDKFVSAQMAGDAMVCDATVLNMQVLERNFSSVTPEIQETLRSMEGVEELHNIYTKESMISLDEKGIANLDKLVKSEPEFFGEEWIKDVLKYQIHRDKEMECRIYALDEWGLGQVECLEGTIDAEKFQSGNYVIISSWGSIFNEGSPLEGTYYHTGDTLSLQLPDGTEKEYTVMAVGKVNYAISCRGFQTFGAEVVLPGQEYLLHTEDPGALFSVLLMQDGKEGMAYQQVQNYTEQEETGLDCILKQTYEQEFSEFVNMFWLVGGVLSFVLAFIGLLNFINAVVMGILTRRQEFLMMEAVGMTGRQCKAMLAWEGIFYVFLTAVVSLGAGAFFQWFLLKPMMQGMWFFEFQFTLLPIFVCLPLLLVIAVLVSVSAITMMQKNEDGFSLKGEV